MARIPLVELDPDTLTGATGGASAGGFYSTPGVDFGKIMTDTFAAAVNGAVMGFKDMNPAEALWGAVLEGAKAHFEGMIEEGMRDADGAGQPGEPYTPAHWDGTDNANNVEPGGFTAEPSYDSSVSFADASAHPDDNGGYTMDHGGDLPQADAGVAEHGLDTSGDSNASIGSSINFGDASATQNGDGTYSMSDGGGGGGGGGFDGGGGGFDGGGLGG